MATLNPLAPEASARLLSVVSSFSGQLVANKGASPKVVKRCMEDVQEVLDEEGTRITKDVRQLLDSALSSLSLSSLSLPDSAELLPFCSCTRSLSLLASALSLLAEPPSPPAPSPISRLPAELVAHIVSFCQVDDLRLRQNTNLALAATCRAFHAAVQPILDAEVHLFTPGQLERAARKLREKSDSPSRVRKLVVDLQLVDMKHQRDGRWAGRLLPPLIRSLGKSESFQTLHMHFRPPTEKYHRDFNADEDLDEYICEALGLSESQWEDLLHFRQTAPSLRDIHIPCISLQAQASQVAIPLFEPPKALQVLRIGHEAYPSVVSRDDLYDANERVRLHKPRGAGNEPYTDLQVLAIPWFEFPPSSLLSIVSPMTLLPSPTITTLEVTLMVSDIPYELEDFDAVFGWLAPTLRRGVLRFRSNVRRPTDDDDFRQLLNSWWDDFEELRHLELGGDIVTNDLLLRATDAPRLEHLTVLPNFEVDFSVLPDTVSAFPARLRSLKVCTPHRPSRFNTPEATINRIMEVCEEKRFKVEFEERAMEYEWLDWEEEE